MMVPFGDDTDGVLREKVPAWNTEPVTEHNSLHLERTEWLSPKKYRLIAGMIPTQTFQRSKKGFRGKLGRPFLGSSLLRVLDVYRRNTDLYLTPFLLYGAVLRIYGRSLSTKIKSKNRPQILDDKTSPLH